MSWHLGFRTGRHYGSLQHSSDLLAATSTLAGILEPRCLETFEVAKVLVTTRYWILSKRINPYTIASALRASSPFRLVMTKNLFMLMLQHTVYQICYALATDEM